MVYGLWLLLQMLLVNGLLAVGGGVLLVVTVRWLRGMLVRNRARQSGM